MHTSQGERYEEMIRVEDLILTVTSKGLGKVTSSHDYPVRGRGGQGVRAIDRDMRGGKLVASFRVDSQDQIMLVTSNGQSIRCPVEGISFQSRIAGGVRVFDTAEDEEVVSVARIADSEENPPESEDDA